MRAEVRAWRRGQGRLWGRRAWGREERTLGLPGAMRDSQRGSGTGSGCAPRRGWGSARPRRALGPGGTWTPQKEQLLETTGRRTCAGVGCPMRRLQGDGTCPKLSPEPLPEDALEGLASFLRTSTGKAALKTGGSVFHSLGDRPARAADNQRSLCWSGLGRRRPGLSTSRDAPRSLLRGWGEAAAPAVRGARGDGAKPLPVPGRGDGERPHLPCGGGGRLGAAGLGVAHCLPATCTPSNRGKCRSCYSSFHSFPSTSCSGRRRGRGFHQASPLPPAAPGVESRQTGALTMPAACVGQRSSAGHDAVESRPCLPPGNTTIFKPAPLTNRKR